MDPGAVDQSYRLWITQLVRSAFENLHSITATIGLLHIDRQRQACERIDDSHQANLGSVEQLVKDKVYHSNVVRCRRRGSVRFRLDIDPFASEPYFSAARPFLGTSGAQF